MAYRSNSRDKNSVSVSIEGQANAATNPMAVMASSESAEQSENHTQQTQDSMINKSHQRPMLGDESLNFQLLIDFNTEHLSWSFIGQMGYLCV